MSKHQTTAVHTQLKQADNYRVDIDSELFNVENPIKAEQDLMKHRTEFFKYEDQMRNHITEFARAMEETTRIHDYIKELTRPNPRLKRVLAQVRVEQDSMKRITESLKYEEQMRDRIKYLTSTIEETTRTRDYIKELTRPNPQLKQALERVTDHKVKFANELSLLARDTKAEVGSILAKLSGSNFSDTVVSQQPIYPVSPSVPKRRRTSFLDVVPRTITEPELPLQASHKVLILCRHDTGIKDTVARFVERFGFKAIILNELPNGGRTKIEKLETNANVDFVITVLTPEDAGASRDNSSQLKSSRSCPDIIFEHTFLCGKLGRERVRILYVGEIEDLLPSYISESICVPMDRVHGWELVVAKEMKYAGLPIDLNNLL